jgi:hypothetical protein
MVNKLDPEIEGLINHALNQAVLVNGPVKLYHGKNGQGGLFASRKGKHHTAALYGFAATPCLWKEEHRASMNSPLQVRLAPGGLDRVLEITSSHSRPMLIKSSSELYRRELLERWADLAAARSWESDFPKIAECCSSLITEIQKLVPDSIKKNRQNEADHNPGTNREIADFKRRLAHELVIAWKFAPNPEARKSIGNALKNSGIQQIGSPSEQLVMDGGLHRCDGPAFPGDKVEVVESGWLVHDGVGEFLLEKAIVKLI